MQRPNSAPWHVRFWRMLSRAIPKGRRSRRARRWWLMLGVSVWLCVAWTPLWHQPGNWGGAAQAQTQSVAQASLAAQARTQYEATNYAAAANLFEQAAMAADSPLQQAALLANASLAYQQAENWEAAAQSIQQARDRVLALESKTVDTLAVTAQVHDVAARLALNQGQPETAVIAWADAVAAYDASGNLEPAQQARLKQAQALQAAGFYRRSIDLLETLVAILETQPPALITLQADRSLGDAYRLTGNLTGAESQLQKSLELAQQLNLLDEISITNRKLGDLARLQSSGDGLGAAFAYYQAAERAAVSALPQFQAQLGQLHLWIDAQQWRSAYDQALALWESQAGLPNDRSGVYARIDLLQAVQAIRQAIAATLADTNSVPTTDWYIFVRDVFATDLNQLRRSTTDSFSQSLVDNPLWYTIDKHFPPLVAVAGELQELRQTARALGDVQAEATILGRLGALYEQIEDWENASQLTQQGLVLAQSYGLGQVAYDLQAQLGRIELAMGDRQRAIAAYRASVATLQTLREDVVSVSSEAQYSFQQSIEPIYRELATLLLTESPDTDSDENLRQAREVIELLQLAELDNFFREACLSGDTVEIDALDNQAAVLYPILLPDRIDVVLSLPDRSYQNFNVPVTPLEVTQAVTTLQRGLLNPLSDATTTARGIGIFVAEGELENRPADQIQILPVAQQLYDLLIRPAEQALADSDVQTLVFVLDDSLRSIPMSVLYDGEQYLIEKYAIAATPGLRLVNPEPLPRKELSVILAGLSQQGESVRADQFSPLPFVADEVKTIEQLFPSTVLLDEAFNVESFKANVGTVPAPIVHLATHGQFGDTLDNTFVLTWDDALDAIRFSNILLTSELSREQPIELLVLSACETAKGDELSVLGLAGIAIRSGARSTLASLWQVSDQATSDLMGEFYQQLGSSDLPKAEAIRQAQLALLNQSQYSHPFYWSAFVLLGNWL